jgi:type IV pilus assembly protein PilV
MKSCAQTLAHRRRAGGVEKRSAGFERRAAGFSMVEVLVSLIIIAVGMLGLAKIQALAYASTGVASQQSLAALEASSLVSAMRANRNYWSAVTTPYSYSSPVGGTPNTDATLSNTYVCTSGGANAPCTAPQLAAFDIQNWVTTLNNTLPNPTATVTCPAPAANAQLGCWIQITWHEENVAVNSQSVGGALTLPTYTLYVVP